MQSSRKLRSISYLLTRNLLRQRAQTETTSHTSQDMKKKINLIKK